VKGVGTGTLKIQNSVKVAVPHTADAIDAPVTVKFGKPQKQN